MPLVKAAYLFQKIIFHITYKTREGIAVREDSILDLVKHTKTVKHWVSMALKGLVAQAARFSKDFSCT